MLLSAERLNVQDVARQAGVSRPAVWRWQQRYGETGVEGMLRDKTRHPACAAGQGSCCGRAHRPEP